MSDAYGSGPNPAWLSVAWREHLSWRTAYDRPVNVLDCGPRDAEPIVFVHGHSGCWQNWLEQLPEFMDDHRVIALDLPGFGRSPMPAGNDVSMSQQGRVLGEVLKQLGVDRATVVGNSMGGFIAAEMAIRMPERVSRLVLVAAAGMSDRYIGIPTEVMRHPSGVAFGRALFALGGMPERQRRSVARRARTRKLALAIVATHPDRLHPALVYELLSGTGAPGAARAAVALADYDFSEHVAGITAPTLVVWGDRDRLVPLRSASAYADTIPGALLEIYDDTGHVPMLERPARFNADLRAFMAGAPVGEPPLEAIAAEEAEEAAEAAG